MTLVEVAQKFFQDFPPYSEYKNSGVEWLGKIPGHWEVKKIKYISTILRGKFSHRPRNDPKLYDGDYPFIQTGDIAATDKYITTYEQTLNALGFAVSKQFPKGTLVMAIAANIGDVAILDFPACFPDSIVLYSMRQAIEEGFILDVLQNYTTFTSYFKLVQKATETPN
ncbi:restriction endonuclease subunit S [Sphaerospermopsis sp. LEGE 00249]|uniref:restriction endonuclease subunit S n=1 Tax=Sphaerospermopsis sp. LEGE 00249 TaxID=1380707 RepID=UPI001C9A37C0|nr:restriction endonuclease subunit S [Sphaerospermopsis sp. LEGE 00249]